MLVNNKAYQEALREVVSVVSSARAEAVQKASAVMVRMYWEIGAVLNRNLEYGNVFIDSLSKDIRAAFPGIKGFSARNLRYMAKFAREVDDEFCNSCCKIPWGHIVKLLSKTEPGEIRNWYVAAIVENGWSRAALDHQIDLHAYERHMSPGKVNNFTKTLPDPQSELIQQALKDPYIFDFITIEQSREERDIEQAMMNNVTSLLLELGTGFAFLGRQYHLEVGGDDFYLDMLFYNVRLHCYVVVELKNERFKPEFNGQLGFYVTAVDGELRGEGDNPTIGLLLCKDKNDSVAKYSLQSTNVPIGISEYRIGNELPQEYAGILPSPEDLLKRL
ncbi:YhcG family protein [uncultured Adlercreutzia sp.]|uniref:PDDEXK nuclease domain-containing protein n=1 Tax=uncultured Adlercreutzia sp. TaxID=875803 RepID=UPI0026F3D7E0|nr:PDDEXK nuclease domain-containing protein [uncultured Adlercreutzia sp.]